MSPLHKFIDEIIVYLPLLFEHIEDLGTEDPPASPEPA
jgi:hypothetical protein